VVRKWELDKNVKAPPYGRIEQICVVGCSEQKGPLWPHVDFLQQYGNQPLKLANFGGIIAALGDRVEFIEKEDAPSLLGIVENPTDILTSAP
jgi:hypothetical protein